MVGILPYAGLKYFVYEELKLKLLEEYKDSITMRSVLQSLGWVVFADLYIPTGCRKNTNAGTFHNSNAVESLLKGENRHESAVCRISSIIRNHGWRQLYAGLSINYIKVVPSVAIGFTTYKAMKSWLHYSCARSCRSWTPNCLVLLLEISDPEAVSWSEFFWVRTTS
ncbi:hypothetical protein MLD38_007885 [Melastoma candidum]|uniref:Uncharacterized protein n=1 Tax=Melastoma candidum TaxID=119954 RepID=A0ACB9RRZ9_9MYRT|nr:hypothetical protein MLD38_007885 [Melastoma candidum]